MHLLNCKKSATFHEHDLGERQLYTDAMYGAGSGGHVHEVDSEFETFDIRPGGKSRG
jgi:hypothetical protein